jgi:hypothetical protein
MFTLSPAFGEDPTDGAARRFHLLAEQSGNSRDFG